MFASLHTASFATRRVQKVGSGPRLWSFMRAVLATHRQRQALARLDDKALFDIGLTREEALLEASRAPWDQTRSRIRAQGRTAR